jgi:hypothetical protein
MTGRVFKATGLYFFLAARTAKGVREGDREYKERSLSDLLTEDRVKVLVEGVDKVS